MRHLRQSRDQVAQAAPQSEGPLCVPPGEVGTAPDERPRTGSRGPRIARPQGGVVSSRSRDSARWNRLREVEDVVRVVSLLHPAKTRQIRPVVGLLPIGQARVDVVLVRALRDG